MAGLDLEIEKMEEVTRYQVTYSKRKASLIKTANDISVSCDVDVALVAFSPTGRVSTFCNQERIEDVLQRYVNLPPERRYPDYELENEKNASLAHILWCERNLKNTLQEIRNRKRALLYETYPSLGQPRVQRQRAGQASFSFNSNIGNIPVMDQARQNLPSSAAPFLNMRHDPRTFPYSSRILNGLLNPSHQPGGISVGASNSSAFNPPMAGGGGGFPSIYHPGRPSFTLQTETPPTYPSIQRQSFNWNQTASSIQNTQFGVFGSSSMQRIMGNAPLSFAPYQTRNVLETSNLYQPMTGTVGQQLGMGMPRSSYHVRLMREDHMTSGIPNQQPAGALGRSFLDQSLVGNGTTSYFQFQAQRRPGVFGTTSVGRYANYELFGAQQNRPPTFYNNYNNFRIQNDASLSGLQLQPIGVNLLNSRGTVTPPVFSDRVISEPIFTNNNIGPFNNPTPSDGGNINNGISDDNSSSSSNNSENTTVGNNDTAEAQEAQAIGHTQETPPPPESPTESFFLNGLLDEDAMEEDKSQTAGNQPEDSSMEWDGFTLAEKLNLEDLDIIY
ncbi:hypothetical protein PTKIN_Ptkin08bG0150600 [Pterospermum kingtungense]